MTTEASEPPLFSGGLARSVYFQRFTDCRKFAGALDNKPSRAYLYNVINANAKPSETEQTMETTNFTSLNAKQIKNLSSPVVFTVNYWSQIERADIAISMHLISLGIASRTVCVDNELHFVDFDTRKVYAKILVNC